MAKRQVAAAIAGGTSVDDVSISAPTTATSYTLSTTEKAVETQEKEYEYKPPVPPQPHNLGDIVYWDGSKLAYTPYTSWKSSLGTALGVCFIPTSHAQVWGDGKARFISVKGVNDDGTASESEKVMFWDNDGMRTAGLIYYTKLPTWDNTIGGSVGSTAINGYMSCQDDPAYFMEQNVIDSLSYYGNSNIFSPYVPSPYAADGTFYADYIRTISGNNALSDFNGKANTTAIVSALGADGGEAAKACSLYSTDGIPAGEWYLPAMGELGYIIPRSSIINNALTACGGILLNERYGYWSSTECNFMKVWRLQSALAGSIYIDSKYDYQCVRPVVSLS